LVKPLGFPRDSARAEIFFRAFSSGLAEFFAQISISHQLIDSRGEVA